MKKVVCDLYQPKYRVKRDFIASPPPKKKGFVRERLSGIFLLCLSLLLRSGYDAIPRDLTWLLRTLWFFWVLIGNLLQMFNPLCYYLILFIFCGCSMVLDAKIGNPTQHYRLTAHCWSVKSGNSGGFVTSPETNHYLQVGSSNCDAQDKRQYIKITTISIWANIIFNISMLFNTSWNGFIIKINISFVHVLIINNALIPLIL